VKTIVPSVLKLPEDNLRRLEGKESKHWISLQPYRYPRLQL